MNFDELGSRKNPTLVCVPGLLGGPENFAPMAEILEPKFHLLIFNPNIVTKAQSLAAQKLSYNSSADDIYRSLIKLGLTQAYFFGISLGGKIVYDFAAKFPHAFLGGVTTDISPGQLDESDIYLFIVNLVDRLDMNQPWAELKKRLMELVPNRDLRILLQTQIHYPERNPPAQWRQAMQYFHEALRSQKLEDQFEDLLAVDEYLAKHKRLIHVFRAGQLSGIGSQALAKMQKMSCFRIHPAPDATHFVQVSHKEAIAEMVVRLRAP